MKYILYSIYVEYESVLGRYPIGLLILILINSVKRRKHDLRSQRVIIYRFHLSELRIECCTRGLFDRRPCATSYHVSALPRANRECRADEVSSALLSRTAINSRIRGAKSLGAEGRRTPRASLARRARRDARRGSRRASAGSGTSRKVELFIGHRVVDTASAGRIMEMSELMASPSPFPSLPRSGLTRLFIIVMPEVTAEGGLAPGPTDIRLNL